MGIQAIITGDIVNSSSLKVADEKKLLKGVQGALLPNKHEFYRGDSFQALIAAPADALRIALLCRIAAIKLSKADTNFDIRLSIGIGRTGNNNQKLTTAKGEAFVLSGHAFDTLDTTGKRIAIACTNVLANEGLQVIANYTDALFKEMTTLQATVIFELLKGTTQQQVAKNLKKSKSTISQHTSAGRWDEIAMLLVHYENIISGM